MRGDYLDVANFPGEAEQTFVRDMIRNVNKSITIKPFSNLEQDVLESLKKVSLNNLKVYEEGKYFILESTGVIQP